MTIRQVQALLIYLGYAPGDPDGIPGAKTRQAVREFQKAAGLAADGSPGEQTARALLAAVAGGQTRRPEDFWGELRYFRREEPGIRCPCPRCGGFPVEPAERLMRLADSIREQAGVPMNPSSTVRCQVHNDELPGSAGNSRHLTGRAMDFSLKGWSSARALALVRKQPGVHYAYAIDGSYVHMDVD